MRKRLLLVVSLILLGFALSACAGANALEEEPTPDPENEGVVEDGFTYGQNAILDDVQAVVLESFPVQVNVLIVGSLRDGCTEIVDHEVSQEDDTFTITLNTRRPVDEECTQALVPFQRTVSLDVEGLPAGQYTVRVGDLTDTFTLEADNVRPDAEATVAPTEVAADEYTSGYAAVREVDIAEPAEGEALNPALSISGYVNDACTEIHRVDDELSTDDPNIVLVFVQTRRQVGEICAQVSETYELTHQLTSITEPGDYLINVNGVTIEYTAEE